MAAESGYDPRIIKNFIKINDLDQLQPGKNYLIEYYSPIWNRFNIAKFLRKEETYGKSYYFFDILYQTDLKSNNPNRQIKIQGPLWKPKDKYGYVYLGNNTYRNPVSIGKEHIVYTKEQEQERANATPDDLIYYRLRSPEYYHYSFYELGPMGDLISETTRPEDVYSILIAHRDVEKKIGTKIGKDPAKNVMNILLGEKKGGKRKTKRKIMKKNKSKKSKRNNKRR
jgi:hypothetical protein